MIFSTPDISAKLYKNAQRFAGTKFFFYFNNVSKTFALRRKFECSRSDSRVARCNPESRDFPIIATRPPTSSPTCSRDGIAFYDWIHKLEGQFVLNCIKIHRAYVFFVPPKRRYVSLSHRLKEIPSEHVTALSPNFFHKKMENCEPNNNLRWANIRIDLGIGFSSAHAIHHVSRYRWMADSMRKSVHADDGRDPPHRCAPDIWSCVSHARWIRISGQRASAETLNRKACRNW